jgi:hypothetical protein
MPPLGPIKRKVLIYYLQRLDFQGPFSGGNHQFMIKGEITENGPESPALSKAGMNGRSFRAGWVEGKHHSSLILCSPQDEERSSSFIVSRLRRNSCKSERRIRYPPLRPNLIARSCFSRIHFRTVRRRVTGRSLPNWNSCVGM